MFDVRLTPHLKRKKKNKVRVYGYPATQMLWKEDTLGNTCCNLNGYRCMPLHLHKFAMVTNYQHRPSLQTPGHVIYNINRSKSTRNCLIKFTATLIKKGVNLYSQINKAYHTRPFRQKLKTCGVTLFTDVMSIELYTCHFKNTWNQFTMYQSRMFQKPYSTRSI